MPVITWITMRVEIEQSSERKSNIVTIIIINTIENLLAMLLRALYLLRL